MELKLNEIIEYIGIEGIDPETATIDDFKSKFTEKFVDINEATEHPDIKSKVSGSIYGGLTTAAKRIFGFKNGDVEGKDMGEIFEMANNKYTTQIEELTTKLSENNPDERLKGLNADLEKANNLVIEKETLAEKLASDLEAVKSSAQSEITNYKINHSVNEEKSKIKFKSDMTPIERAGFDTILNSEYKLGLEKPEGSEIEKLVIYDKDGARIRNTKAASGYLEPLDVFTSIAEQNRLLAVNNGGGGTPTPEKIEKKEPDRKLSYTEELARKRAEENIASMNK